MEIKSLSCERNDLSVWQRDRLFLEFYMMGDLNLNFAPIISLSCLTTEDICGETKLITARLVRFNQETISR